MRIKNACMEFSKGSAILKYPITQLELLEIKKNGLFNYQESLFENTPPSFFKEGNICIVAEAANGAAFREGEEFNLDDKLWEILSIETDHVVYPTFFLLRKEGKLQGTLNEAMLNFALKKSCENENLPEEAQRHVKQALSRLMDIGVNDKTDGESLEKVTTDFISGIAGNFEHDDAVSIIEKFLAAKEIPFKKEGESYYFTTNSGKYDWHVELEVLKDAHRAILYSSVSFKTADNLIDALLRDINQLNQTFSIGHFQIDVDEKILYFKNDLEINIFTLEHKLEPLFESNFNAMKTMIPVLMEKFGNRIVFEL